MITQQQNVLTLTFPTTDSATTFATFLKALFQPSEESAISSPPSGLSPALDRSTSPILSSPQPSILDSLEQKRSQHTVLTDERLEALFNQRQQGQTQHQRLLRAQTTLRDGVLPFSKPGETPAPSGQPSPRQRAQQEGGFADGQADPPEVERRKKSRLQPVSPKTSKS